MPLQGVLMYPFGYKGVIMNSEHWRDMSDEQRLAVIKAEGTKMTPDQVTTKYINGMRNYRNLYPTYGNSLLSFMVRIDTKNGINVCSCGGAAY